jgi:competence protein ComEC
MGAFAIVGLLLGREYAALFGLWGTALVMTLISPQVLYDIGFELSFMATLGLILIANPLQNLPQFKNWPAFLKEGLLMGFAAEAMTLPLSIFYFKQISLVSLPTSLLTLPALPIIMATGALVVGGGWVFSWWLPGLVSVLGWLSWLFLAYMIAVVDLFASLPFASVSLNAIHPIWLVVYYGLLAFILTYARSEKFRLRVSTLPPSPITFGLMGFSAVGIWVLALFF